MVAGIDAGRSYAELAADHHRHGSELCAALTAFDLTAGPGRNFFENAGLVQFIHRMSAYVLFGFGIFVWMRGRRSANTQTRFGFNTVIALLAVQMVIGILTVLYSAPVHIAIVHQFAAVLLWIAILRARYLARYPLPQSIRRT